MGKRDRLIQIKFTKHQFAQMRQQRQGGQNDASEWVDDESTELFSDCNTLLDEASADIHTTVENLNNYLNSVAAG